MLLGRKIEFKGSRRRENAAFRGNLFEVKAVNKFEVTLAKRTASQDGFSGCLSLSLLLLVSCILPYTKI